MEGDQKDMYRECLRNHAASIGSYATDGCGEFTSDDSTALTSPAAGNNNNQLQCAACGCHRNFHRKVTYIGSNSNNGRAHGHIGALSCTSRGRADTDMTDLVDYGAGGVGLEHSADDEMGAGGRFSSSNIGKMKRFRTKFTSDQKDKMLAFAEKLGWKLQRKDLEDEIRHFCRSIGVSRQVFKVWMHNHKNSSSSTTAANSTGNASSLTQ